MVHQLNLLTQADGPFQKHYNQPLLGHFRPELTPSSGIMTIWRLGFGAGVWLAGFL
jgi:hypothetical protein